VKRPVIHISTGTTTTTTSILLITITLILTGCIQNPQKPAPKEQVQAFTPTPSEIESGAVFEITIPTSTPWQCATVIAEQALNLRSEPSETSQIKGWMKAGQIVAIAGRAGDWTLIITDTNKGYARADYLQESECQ
jgi:uncharacterized protein YgiM (DUF1202 family)